MPVSWVRPEKIGQAGWCKYPPGCSVNIFSDSADSAGTSTHLGFGQDRLHQPARACTSLRAAAQPAAALARAAADAAAHLLTGRTPLGRSAPWRVMDAHPQATADLAAQLGDLALNARVQIHGINSHPYMNGL